MKINLTKGILLWAFFLALGAVLLLIGVVGNIKYFCAKDFSELSEASLKRGVYVSGDLSSDSLPAPELVSRGVLYPSRFSEIYTVRMKDGKYIRVRIDSEKTQELLEHGEIVHFKGIAVKDETDDDRARYYPVGVSPEDLVEDLIVRETRVIPKTALGFAGLMILECCIMLLITGSLRHTVSTEPIAPEPVFDERYAYHLNEQIANELVILDRLERKREMYRIYFSVCLALCVVTVFFFLRAGSWPGRLLGFLLFLVLVRQTFHFFLNFGNRVSLFICTLFCIDSISKKMLESEERLSQLRRRQ